MKVILSHPFSGALYWWFADQLGHVRPAPKRPELPYYRTLYSDVDKNLDIALACTVIFDEIVIPPADAWFPRDDSGPEPTYTNTDLSISVADWEAHRYVRGLVEPIEKELLADRVIKAVLARVPARVRGMALIDSGIDIVMAAQYAVPIICATGRMRIISRLVELGAIPVQGMDTEPFVRASSITNDVSQYTTVAGLTFHTDNIGTLARIKANEVIRRYSEEFQSSLRQADAADESGLWQSIAATKYESDIAGSLSGYFKATSKIFSLISLIPGISIFTGIAAVGTDWAHDFQDRKVERLDWYQLGPEIQRFRSEQSINDELKRRRLI